MQKDEISAKAEQLALDMTRKIDQARQALAEDMLEKGCSPMDYAIADNIEAFVEDPRVGYKCYPILKTDLGEK